MARNTNLIALTPKNNNNQRKRLEIHTSKKDLINEKCNIYRKLDRKIKLRFFIFTLFALTIMAISLFSTSSKLKLKKMEYNNLDSKYISYELTRSRLKTNLERAIDIKEIQRYALEELGMVYADENNTVIVNVNR